MLDYALLQIHLLRESAREGTLNRKKGRKKTLAVSHQNNYTVIFITQVAK